jgi:hypothetical protein
VSEVFSQMSYATRVDECIGKHVALFQQELALAKTMSDCLEKPCPMPYGYPLRVWCPCYVRRSPQAKRFVPRVRGRLSNGMPPMLRLRLSDGYVLGLYSPRNPYRKRVGGFLRFRRKDPEGSLLEHGMHFLTLKPQWSAGDTAESS